MRTLRKNKQIMYYSLQGGEVPIYQRDENGDIEYIEIDGVKIPIETGEYEVGYFPPVKFSSNIAMGGSETQAEVFGIDVSGYDATIIYNKGEFPLTETSIIWFQTKPSYTDAENTVVDSKSADYRVVKIVDSLNFTMAVLKKNVK